MMKTQYTKVFNYREFPTDKAVAWVNTLSSTSFEVATSFGNATITKKEALHLLSTCEEDIVFLTWENRGTDEGYSFVILEQCG